MLSQIDWSHPWYDSVRAAFERLGLEATTKAVTIGPLEASPEPVILTQAGIHASYPILRSMDSRLRGNDGLAVSQGPLQARGLLEALNAGAAELALRNERGLPISFVPQGELPEGRAYEDFIGATGCVPTRENLHDFFNALVWLSFPRIKRQLNALQAAQIALAGIGKSRGPARDGATIFDENSALLVVRDTPESAQLVEALRAHEWRAALYERRAMFGRDAQVWLFGHALMEKLVAPRKAMTAHTRVFKAGPDYFALTHDAQRAWIDEHVARELAAEGLSTACFTPLPVLGVPGWWEGQGEDFYADTSVFRQKRSRNP